MKGDRKILQELEVSRKNFFKSLQEVVDLTNVQVKLLGDNLRKQIEIQQKKVREHFLNARREEFLDRENFLFRKRAIFLEWINSKEIIELAKTDKQIQDFIKQKGYSLFSII